MIDNGNEIEDLFTEDSAVSKDLHAFEQTGLTAISRRLLNMLRLFEPDLSSDDENLISLLLACCDAGDTRIRLDKDYIHFVIKSRFGDRKDFSVPNFEKSCCKALDNINASGSPFHKIIGYAKDGDLKKPLVIADGALYLQKYYVAKEMIVSKIVDIFPPGSGSSEDSLSPEFFKKVEIAMNSVNPPLDPRQA